MSWILSGTKAPGRSLLIGALFLVATALAAHAADKADHRAGILKLDASPHAKLHNVPVSAVTVSDGFWAKRRKVNVDRSIPTLLLLLEENGIVDNFRRLSGRKDVQRQGPLYTDSDLYKWMEAAAFVLQSEDHPELREKLDGLIDDVLAAQEPSGYLNTYYAQDRVPLRFQEMQSGHELYCLGHMLQAGIAYYRATGNRRLLDAGIKFVEYLLETSGPGKRPLLTGHPELELALVELYRTTGDRRHLELAGYLLQGDSRLDLKPVEIMYMFSGKPFTQRAKLEGHAVRAMYATSGATDYFLETGDTSYWETLEKLWTDMVRGKMYITGGVGSRSRGEAFGEPYELPNQLAYTESCAAIGNMIWNWRMLAATGEARFADVLERALYNGVNSGMSIDGTLYCYRNPLELVGNPEDKIRNPWYSTTCCPPNLERILASLPGYFYGTSADGVYVHLYDNNQLDWQLEDGTGLKLRQETNYPWDGAVDISVEPEQPHEFTVFLRIPGWAPSAEVRVNGQSSVAPKPGEYLPLRRQWEAGDEISIRFDLTPQPIEANPRVRENEGRVAVQRGPLVYAMEGLDQPTIDSIFDVKLSLSRPPGGSFSLQPRPALLGGITMLQHPAFVPGVPSASNPLYAPVDRRQKRDVRAVQVSLIPYYTFSNRGATEMQVWIPYSWEQAGR